MLQVMVTVWVSAHPVIYILPHKYSAASDSCQQFVNELMMRRIPKSYRKLRIECIRAVGEDA